MAITKCKQSEEQIVRAAQAAFPDKEIAKVEELSEGMCNAAYKLTFADGCKAIMKIASPHKSGFLTNECGLMDAEVRALKLISEKTDVKVPKVYAYDASRTICEGDYFFMECMEGENWITVFDAQEEEMRDKLRRQQGEVQKKLTLVTNTQFGMLGDEEHVYGSLFEFVFYLIKNVLKDAAARDVEVGVSAAEILTALAADKACFDEVKIPSLVHWDMWEGNIFVKDGTITGIIDWERTMWGEAFMDEPFRRHKRSAKLLEGFGITESDISETEMRRIHWYDVFLYLTMMTEVFYREYENKGQYYWAKGLFEEAWEKIKTPLN